MAEVSKTQLVPTAEVSGLIADMFSGTDPKDALAKAIVRYGVRVVLSEILRMSTALTNRSTRQLLAADAKDESQALARFRVEAEARINSLETATDADRERLQALFVDHQFWRLQRNYEFEWLREPIDERKRMLEYAAKGALNVRLTVGELARTERTLRELDPDDVFELHRLSVDPPKNGSARPASRQFETLEAAGCVRWAERTGLADANVYQIGTLYIHELGRNVLQVLDAYIAQYGGSND